ncbi:MAG TPA: hypothetical protein VGZ32_06005 [Actinocrinis sp.]|jgi:hypothetical protein|uniref:hypothetical protein n=1 Tax=Actinocrinis sp. TaxID=1920516 RepID=UPI002DDCF3A3|nr:hypothetical protein [Actinocrinis sp.]HEV3169870.1 hypothetical protein [Actinocrinis sp.]
MTEVTETTQEKGQSALLKAAGAGMALLGSSTAGTSLAGGGAAHADHGHTVARWWGVSLSLIGWLAGGILFPFTMVPAVVVIGVFQIAAIVATLALNAAGYGRPDVWGELKAQAAAERTAG